MRPERIIHGGALVLALALGAFADRATSILDGVEAVLQSVAADLADNTTKDGKKRFKTASKSLKKLGKETTSELGDLKLLKKIAGATLKRFSDEPDVVQPIVAAADAFDASIDADLASARALVPPEAGAKVKPSQVSRAIERAQRLLDKSRGKDTRPRIAVLFKARKAADKAVALAEKLEPLPADLDGIVFLFDEVVGGDTRLTSLDLATGTVSPIDTGVGSAELTEPAPATSPDGDVLAFQQGTDMVFVDLAGRTVALGALTAGDWEYSSWAPDSSVLLASGRTDDVLVVFDALGGVTRSFSERVYRGFPVEETFLWSPDGAFVAYRTDRNTDGVKELQVLEIATGVITEVTTRGLGTDQYRYVAWGGQSNRLVFPEDFDRQTSDTELVVVNADGTGRMVISQPGQDVRDAGSNVNTLKTNPAGDGVLYEFRESGTGFLGTVNLDGTNPEVVATASANFINEHAWSPDGARIAYIDGGALHTCDPDGSGAAQVTSTCPDFQWAPDGSAIVYRDGNGSFANELFVSDPDGADPLRLSPPLVGGGNVEPFYSSTVTDAGLTISFVADSEVNNRPDQHVVVVSAAGPGKFEEQFRRIVEAQVEFSDGSYELKSLDSSINRFRARGAFCEEFRYLIVTICRSLDPEPVTLIYKLTIEELPLGAIPRLEKSTLDIDGVAKAVSAISDC